MDRKKTIKRSTQAQIKYLWQYMSENPEFRENGKNPRTPYVVDAYAREWALLKAALDQLGPSKTVEQWKIAWRDQKRMNKVDYAINISTGGKEESFGDEELNGCTYRVKNYRLIVDPLDNLTENSVDVDVKPDVDDIALRCASPLREGSEPSRSGGPAAASPPPDPRPSRLRTLLSRPTRRACRPIRPPSNTHKELNILMKSLIKEVRRSNDLKEEQNNILRVISEKFCAALDA